MFESPRSAARGSVARAAQLVGSVSLSSRRLKRGVIELALLAVLYVG